METNLSYSGFNTKISSSDPKLSCTNENNTHIQDACRRIWYEFVRMTSFSIENICHAHFYNEEGGGGVSGITS